MVKEEIVKIITGTALGSFLTMLIPFGIFKGKTDAKLSTISRDITKIQSSLTDDHGNPILKSVTECEKCRKDCQDKLHEKIGEVQKGVDKLIDKLVDKGLGK